MAFAVGRFPLPSRLLVARARVCVCVCVRARTATQVTAVCGCDCQAEGTDRDVCPYGQSCPLAVLSCSAALSPRLFSLTGPGEVE